jgi:hypothetical protein
MLETQKKPAASWRQAGSSFAPFECLDRGLAASDAASAVLDHALHFREHPNMDVQEGEGCLVGIEDRPHSMAAVVLNGRSGA